MKLSILICTLPERIEMLDRLLKLLHLQYNPDFEILINNDEQMSIGEKRNHLLQSATGKYVCFIDDDDIVSAYYIDLLMEGIDKRVDCCSLRGEYSVDGNFDGVFEHSIKYKQYKTVENSPVKYERYPNHLNCIKASIAKRFKFPETNWGEDTDWATQIHKSGLIKTEHYIPDVIYHYLKVNNVLAK